MADFSVIDHGSVVTIKALSEAARDFAEENFAVPGWMGSPHHFTTDHRPAHQLVEQIIDEGFDVAGI